MDFETYYRSANLEDYWNYQSERFTDAQVWKFGGFNISEDKKPKCGFPVS